MTRVRYSLRQSLLLAIIAVSAGLAAQVMGARLRPVPAAPTTDAITHVPRRIGAWQAINDPTVPVNPARPDSTGRPGQVYDAMVSRTYVAPDGTRVMLMLAYQNQQFQEDRVHSPELCYYAQGFILNNQKSFQIKSKIDSINARSFIAKSLSRAETVVYFIRTGDNISERSIDSRNEIFRSGVLGRIDDGILVRVSMIDSDSDNRNSDEKIRLMVDFIEQMVAASPSDSRTAMLGSHEL